MESKKKGKVKFSTIFFGLFFAIIIILKIIFDIEYYSTDNYGTTYEGIVTDKYTRVKSYPQIVVQNPL